MRVRHLAPALLAPLILAPAVAFAAPSAAPASPAAPTVLPNGKPAPKNVGPAVTKTTVKVIKVSQKGQEKIPVAKRIATITITVSPGIPKAAQQRIASRPNANLSCAPNYPTGYVDSVGATNVFGVTLIHYEQDVYFCWSHDTDMLYGVPQVYAYHSASLGWGFDNETPATAFEPYPYVFHTWRMGQFSFGWGPAAYHQYWGLDAYAYWSGSFHIGPHNGRL